MEELQKRVFLHVSDNVLMAFCVASVALCDSRCVSARICARDRREGNVAVPIGKTTRTCPSRRVRRCVHVVCVACVALCDIRCVSAEMCAHDRCETKVAGSWESHQNVSFSTCRKMCSCRFAWQVWHFVTFDVFQGMCVRDRRGRKVAASMGKATKTSLSTLHTPVSTLHFKIALYTRHSILYTPHFTLHTLHFTLRIPHSPLSTPHLTLHTLHTLHSTLYTPHSTLHTLHSTLYTPHFTLHT